MNGKNLNIKIHPFWEFFPWGVLALGIIYFLAVVVWPAKEKSDFDLEGFASLPVKETGRVKPMDTVARNSLLVLSGRQTYDEEKEKAGKKEKERHQAVKWLLDIISYIASPQESPAYQYKVFRIENDQVLGFLNLEPRPGFRYSYQEIEPRVLELGKRADLADKTEDRDLFDNKILELASHVEIYRRLATLTNLLVVPPPVETARKVLPGQDEPEWKTLYQAAREDRSEVIAFAKILRAYRQGNPEEFNRNVEEYRNRLQRLFPAVMSASRFEVFFNQFAPFYQCSIMYGVVFLLACLGWLVGQRAFHTGALWLGMFTLVVHTWGLIARMYLQGRPPVTNLYSSAIFIGWGCVLFGLVQEWIFKNGVGNVVAAVTGGLSLIVGHNLATSGDTLEVMRAVLDTNFWLATHVVCITLGYTATFVTGFLGIFYIFSGVASSRLTQDLARDTMKMLYGILCFATFFSFTGTVLGGIWADQSWGRFWGWDPKENGALLIVLWNALVLHARWGGLVKQRGMAVLAVGGNIITSWSWFGVNMLGIGLHSYGFMSGALFWLGMFGLVNLAIMGVGMLPLHKWRSFAPRTEKLPSPIFRPGEAG